MFAKKSEDTSTADQLKAARAQHAELHSSLPRLERAAADAVTAEAEAKDRLGRLEGDVQIGRATDAEVAAVRAKHEAAVKATQKANALVRDAKEKLKHLTSAIDRLLPEHHADRYAFYMQRHQDLSETLAAQLEAAAVTNAALQQNYLDAYGEFPPLAIRDSSKQPYRTALGLEDLSVPYLRRAAEGAVPQYLDRWLTSVRDFFHPPAPAEPRRRNVLFEMLGGPQPQRPQRGIVI